MTRIAGEIAMSKLAATLLFLFTCVFTIQAQETITKAELRTHIERKSAAISYAHDFAFETLKLSSERILQADGQYSGIRTIFSQQRDIAEAKTDELLELVQSFNLPADTKALKAVDEAMIRGVENISITILKKIDKLDELIIELKMNGQDPYSYLDVHYNQTFDYVEDRNELYRLRDEEIEQIVEQTLEARLSLWR